MRRNQLTYLESTVLVCLTGCAASPLDTDAAAQRKMLALLMPSRIQIVEPFTRVKSFDDDSTPDGIELFLQAVNSLGNAGLNIVGTVRAELYEYVPTSAESKGRRLEHWQVELATSAQQRTYWNGLTQMYEFQLAIDPAKIPGATRYVLAVSYHSPLGEHLTDEYVISYRSASGAPGPKGAP